VELKGTGLAVILNSEIDAQTDDDTSRGDVIARMARAAGISSSTVNQILGADINCPPLSRLEGFAEVLGVSMARLRTAAESDGCEYADDGKALHCRLIKKGEVTTGYIQQLIKKYDL
jgi:hypothetical protein